MPNQKFTLGEADAFIGNFGQPNQDSSGTDGVSVSNTRLTLIIAGTFTGVLTPKLALKLPDNSITYHAMTDEAGNAITYTGSDLGTYIVDVPADNALFTIGFESGDFTSGEAEIYIGVR